MSWLLIRDFVLSSASVGFSRNDCNLWFGVIEDLFMECSVGICDWANVIDYPLASVEPINFIFTRDRMRSVDGIENKM